MSDTPSRFPEIVIPDETIYQTLFGSLTEEQLARPAITDSTTGQEASHLLTMKTLGDAGITVAASAGLPGESVIAEGCPAPEVDLDQATDIAVLPFLHIYGMNLLLNASLLHRMHLVTMPALDLVNFLEVIERYRVELTCIAPPIAVALAKHPVVAEDGLTGMKHMVSGAAALDGELADAVSHRIDSTVVRATA